MQLAKLHRTLPTFAIGFHEVGKDRIGKHRHMAEDIMENIRFLQVVELCFRADESARREAAIGQMIEENLVWHQFRHGHNAPSRDCLKPVRQLLHVRYSRGREFQRCHGVQRRLAGPFARHLLLATKQPVPPVVFGRRIGGPILIDRKIGRAGGTGVAVLWGIFCIKSHRGFRFGSGAMVKYSRSHLRTPS